MVELSRPYMTTWKTIGLTMLTFVGKVMSLLNPLPRFVIDFLPRSKHLKKFSWLQSLSTVILEPKKIKSVTVSTFFCIYLPWSDRTRCQDLLFFLMLNFKPAFSLSSFSFIKRLFSSSSISAIKVVSSGYLRLLFLLEILILACEERTEVKGKGKRERYAQMKAVPENSKER